MRHVAITVTVLLLVAGGRSVAAQEAPKAPPGGGSTTKPLPEDPEIAAARTAYEKAAKATAATMKERPKDPEAKRKARSVLAEEAKALENLVAVLEKKGRPARTEAARLYLLYRILADLAEPELPSPPGPAGAGSGARDGAPVPGSPCSASAARALDWLARHQFTKYAAGGWDSDGFESKCQGPACQGPGGPLYDPGLTGLAVLAFLRSGCLPGGSDHGAVVRDGLAYLDAMQDAEGGFGPRASGHFIYCQGLASLAMASALHATKDPSYRGPTERAASFIARARNPFLAWRYGVRPVDNDTSVTVWMVEALHEATEAGLPVDPEAFEGAVAFIEHVVEKETGRIGYTLPGNGPARPENLKTRFPPERSESMTAAGILVLLRSGKTRENPIVRRALGLLDRRLPAWDPKTGDIDFYYWYLGTVVSRESADDAAWGRWRAAVVKALLSNQRGEKDRCARGSWDPIDPWGEDGGRIYSTSMAALTLLECDRRAVPQPGK